MKEPASNTVLGAAKSANDSLFYIMNKTPNHEIKMQCHETIQLLTEKFPILGLCSKCSHLPSKATE